MIHYRIGWDEHEDLWIQAAITLDMAERMMAFRDIAAMTRRTEAQVRYRATELRNAARSAAGLRRAA